MRRLSAALAHAAGVDRVELVTVDQGPTESSVHFDGLGGDDEKRARGRNDSKIRPFDAI